jgi:tetratricopeptide repeat protein
MSRESPPRLVDGEFGPILRAADTPIPPERIASNGAAIKAAIAGGLVRSSFALWKLLLPLLLIVGAAIVAPRLLSSPPDEPTPSPVATPSVSTSSDAPVIVVTHEDPAPIVDAPVEVVEPPHPARTKRVEPPPVGVDVVVVDAGVVDGPPPSSDLPAQIQLYEDARALAAKGDVAGGLAKLDELLARYPATPLRAEAELTRGELLARTNRHDDAAAALEALANDPSHRGRRGELLRALGDVRRKQGDCPRAIDAYTRARDAGLGAGEKAKVERGLAACAPR